MKYTEVQARQALVSLIQETWKAGEFKTVVLFGENQTRPNMDKLQQVMEYDIEIDDRDQITVETEPAYRTTGKVVFTFGAREGTGTIKLLEMRDFCSEVFRARWAGYVRLGVPTPRGDFNANGWKFYRLDVPFRYDDRRVP